METGTSANKEWAQSIKKGTFKRIQVTDDAESSPSQPVPVYTLQIMVVVGLVAKSCPTLVML